ncbi:MAG: cupin domain-containing protein [Elusimicrobiota bacterium]
MKRKFKVSQNSSVKIKAIRYGGLDLRRVWELAGTAGISAYHVTMPAHYRHETIYHAHTHEWFYVLSGTTTVTVDGKPRRLRPGSSIYMAPGVPHLVRAGKEPVKVLAFFSPSMDIAKPDVVKI